MTDIAPHRSLPGSSLSGQINELDQHARSLSRDAETRNQSAVAMNQSAEMSVRGKEDQFVSRAGFRLSDTYHEKIISKTAIDRQNRPTVAQTDGQTGADLLLPSD